MKKYLALILFLALFLVLGLIGSPSIQATMKEPADSSPSGEGWVCPPCGDDHDDQVFSEGGECPVCGMTLQPLSASATANEPVIRVGILLFDGVQIIDYTGPYEVFGQADFEVVTVSEAGQAITTTMGMTVVPSHSFATAPSLDIVLVPGGQIHEIQTNSAALAWLKSAAADTDHVLSVCNGAFILGRAGLLDGKIATTFHKQLDELELEFPRTSVVRDRRFTDNGKVVTSAGLSAGIDASLHLVSKIKGELAAKSLALHLEYGWDPEAGFVRGVLADRHLPELRLGLPADTTIDQTSSVGDRDRWEVRFAIATQRPADEIVRFFRQAAAKVKGWTLISDHPSLDGASWSLNTVDDGLWRLDLTIEGTAGADGLSGVVNLARFESTRS